MASRARKKVRRRLRLAAVLVILAVVAGAALCVGTGRVVVPGVTAWLYPIPYANDIARAADRYGVDPYLVAAVARAESNFDPQAVSRAGAVGLMQIMPETARWITGLDSWQGRRAPNLKDPGDNVELGACYLAFLLREFDQDTRMALAAYNAGQGVVAAWKDGLQTDGSDGGSGQDGQDGAPGQDAGSRLSLADIRFAETREFVKRVERFRDLYTRAHPDLFVGETAQRGESGT